MHTESPVVSIVIPAFNEEKRLRQSVEQIRDACRAAPDIAAAYEIIICDNNSTDATATVAEQAGCRVIFEPVNQISRARNRGASVASGEWLIFIDADSWPSPELIGDLVPLLSDETCIGCGSTIRVIDGPRWFKFVWESKNWSMRIFKWCPGGFILCRRDAFREIGGFSEEHYLFEELDFVMRLKRYAATRGQKFIILHKHPFSTSGRRGIGKGFWWWARFALHLSLFHERSVRDKKFAQVWYKAER
jgi:glycosyltransferase involved in cell wall biosynthesis